VEYYTRDVNFGFFQKSIIILKKIDFFRLSNLSVAGRGPLRNVPHTMRYRLQSNHVT